MIRRILVVAATALTVAAFTAAPATARPATGIFPDSCAEIHTARPSAGDGDYLLGTNSRLVPVYCHDMADTPREYVTLGSVNYSQYTSGGASSGSNVITTFAKVRIDPVTLTVDINDLTFATSIGQLMHDFVTVTAMPYAVAMSCDGTPSGVGRVDLTGTAFVLADTFTPGGYYPQGSTTVSADNRIADLISGGYCGWTTPAPFIYNPMNPATPDFHLELACGPFDTADVLVGRACVNLT
jgi:hypothetical protein